MDIARWKTDETLENEGVWQPAGEGCELKIARLGNPESTRLLRRYERKYRRQIDNGTLSPEKDAEITARVYAEAILLDWRGMKESGVEVPYSTENAFRLLNEYRELREMVADYAKDAEAYRQAELEDAEGN